MEFRVLGSIEVVGAYGRCEIARGRQLALLALLLANSNRVVSADRILDALWGDDPPDSGAKAVVFHVSRLRDALDPRRAHDGAVGGADSHHLATVGGGYRLQVSDDEVDATRFERDAAAGRALLADDPAAARERFARALDLWSAERPYEDVADEAFVQPEIARLQELRLRTLEDLADADLALGHHREVAARLGEVVTANPLRERLRGQLAVALYRSRRQADALRVLADGRAILSTELGIDPGPELRQLEAWVLAQDPRIDGSARLPARNPYKGLRPFGEADAGDFFGREDLVERLLERLGQVARAGRLLFVVGPSGSGKSSVVRAGLIPALRAGRLPGSERWPIAIMLPGTHPLQALASALAAAVPALASSRDAFRIPSSIVGATHDTALAAALATATAPDEPVLLVLDQAEELFTLADEPSRAQFLAQLLAALAAPDSRLLVAATLRADTLTYPLRVPGLGELIRAGVELVTPLDRNALERAIVQPAEKVGATLEPGLASEIIADLGRQPGELPLLQYSLTELFARGDGTRLVRTDYLAIGGVAGALARRADEALDALAPPERELARQVFLRLVAVGPAGDPAARRVPRGELEALAADPAQLNTVLEAFAGRRLLSFDRDTTTGEGTVEIAHEALVARWPRLANWVDEARDDLIMLRRVAEATADWLKSGRERGFLLSGAQLDRLAGWAASTHLRLDPGQRALLDASLDERQRQVDAELARAGREHTLERRAASRLRVLAAVLLGAVIVTSWLSLALYGQGETAREQEQIAVARERAAASIGGLGQDPRLALLLAWYAADATAAHGYIVEEALDALHWALQASHVAYPPIIDAVAVRVGPNGLRGTPVLAPETLMAIAASQSGRGLSSEECRSYLHVTACPAPPSAARAAGALKVYAGGSLVPAGRFASPSLAGTRVEIVSQLPISLEAPLRAIEARDGIAVTLVPDDGDGLDGRVAAGTIPDVAIVARPFDVASLGLAGLLVDQSGFAAAAPLHEAGAGGLLALDTIGPDRAWPAASGRLVGMPLAIEASSLVWYPKQAFAVARYQVPSTRTELDALTARIIDAGGSPWCLGITGGPVEGASAVGFVEDQVLGGVSGPMTYDDWVAGRTGFDSPAILDGFNYLDRVVFNDGSVLGGPAAAVRIPQDVAAWPLSDTPPGCWLHLGGGAERLEWHRGQDGTLAAFPMPATDPNSAGVMRGRLYSVVVFHDRPEVRRVLDLLVGTLAGGNGMSSSPSVSATLAAAGLWQVGSDTSALPEAGAIGGALRRGLFRVSASDLVSRDASAALARVAAQLVSSKSGPAERVSETRWLLAQVVPLWPVPRSP